MLNVEEIKLRNVTALEKQRMREIVFYELISQMKNYGGVSQAPMGTTTVKMLATLVGCNPDVLDFIWDTLNQPKNVPTTDETVVTLKRYKVSAAKAPFTNITYYKSLRRYRQAGEYELLPVLSEIQHDELRKFLSRWFTLIRGKRWTSLNLLEKYNGGL